VRTKRRIYSFRINASTVREDDVRRRCDRDTSSSVCRRLDSSTVDICSQRSSSASDGVHLTSPSFPNEYPNNVNCTCSIEPVVRSRTPVILDVEVSRIDHALVRDEQQVAIGFVFVQSLSFNLQDNDYLSSTRSLSFSGTLPFGVSLITDRDSLQLTFATDETLSQSGFWIRLHGTSIDVSTV
jgi:hypothetical protein